MTELETRIREIKHNFTPTTTEMMTIVTFKDGTTLHGFFANFDDEKEQNTEGKMHFIKANNSVAFQKEYEETKKYNPVHREVIDISLIGSIELIEWKTNIRLKRILYQ